MQRIKVLHIITHLPIGGAQDNTLLTVEGLNKKKYDVTLLTGPGGEWLTRARNIPNLNAIIVPEIVREINFICDFISIIKIFRIIKEYKFDIVHTHSSKPGFSGRIAAKLAKVPCIIHTIHGFPFHDFMPWWSRTFYITLEKCLAKFTDKLITVCDLNKEKAIQLKIGPPEKFKTIYSGIDFSKFEIENKVNKHELLNMSINGPLVGMIGRLSEQKAPHIFINAIPLILEKIPDAIFILVGDGELRQKVESLIKKLRIQDHTFILGFRDDIPQILSILDVFVLSSFWEGLGRSLTEAMYMKCPVVATKVEGVPELVEHNEMGFLVPPNNPDAIAKGVIELLGNQEKARIMALKAHERVVHDFSVQKMVFDIDNLYNKLFLKMNFESYV